LRIGLQTVALLNLGGTSPPPTTAALEITIPAESTCSGDIDISY